jgi:nucleotide-binding universal stress UspA family protein
MKPILVATDGSPTAKEALRRAIELARLYDAPLLVLTVWNVTLMPFRTAFVPVIPDLHSVAEEECGKVLAVADEAARKAGVHVRTMLRRGYPSEEICTVARERDAQLIVLGSHGWGAVRRMIFGSVSTAVLHHADRPVLVVPAVAASPGHVAEEQRERDAVEA